MSWAERRRALIISIATAVALAALAILAFSIFYKTPTCTDRKQNQDELGTDCGGSCTTLCASQVAAPARVRFVRPLTPQPGRTDIIAYIDNPNESAEAHRVPFLLEVYDADGALIAKRTIYIDLPPSSTVPLYVSDVAPRSSIAAQAFLSIDADSFAWSRAGEQMATPAVEEILVEEGERPRITATLVNPLATPYYEVVLVATVFDSAGTAIAASQTLVPRLSPQGTSPLVFTWNEPFSAPVARVEILPVPDLPAAR